MIINENIERTLPSVNFDEVKGTLELKGRSISPAPEPFYRELIDYVKVYSHFPKDLHLTVDLEYFNTKSANGLLELFKTCKKIEEKNAILSVNFIIEEGDQDMTEVAEDFSQILNVPFKMIYKPASENTIS